MQPTRLEVTAIIPQCPQCGSNNYIPTEGAMGGGTKLLSLTCGECGEDILADYAVLADKPGVAPLFIALGIAGVVAAFGLAVVLMHVSAQPSFPR